MPNPLLHPRAWFHLQRFSIRVLSRKVEALEAELKEAEAYFGRVNDLVRAGDAERHALAESLLSVKRRCTCGAAGR